jgi:hypothetical protein
MVTVLRPSGGTVTSSDGKINCGPASTATTCAGAWAWNETATLVATPSAGMMLGTWAGDCFGRTLVDGKYTCFLDARTSGADKYVVTVFGEAGRTQHANFTDPALHGLEALKWIAKQPDTFECTYCHAASYAGMGIAPSCTDCHAKNGHPDWLNDCTFCHGAPPPPPPATYPGMTHPAVSSDLGNCFGCHQGTVDQDGKIIPGGNHMNGAIDATGGHAEGYADPKIHGRDFFGAISSSPTQPYCTGCHGTSYDVPIASGRSCNTCHAAPTSATPPGGGWNGTEWRSNCTFCHGATKLAYVPASDLASSAPPDALSQRLTGTAAPDRTGAHAAHLTKGPFAGPMLCSNCHAVPSALTHISGRDVRAAVVVQGPGASGPELGYQADATCATRCHGTNGSPAWTSTGLACSGCHEVPPASSIHAGLGSDTTVCAICHPATITAAGAIDVTGGKHVNGVVDRIDGHSAGFDDPAVHGPAYLDHIAGAPGATDCKSCHGASLDYCSSCHAQPSNGGWASWQDNCTFCHGTKTAVFTAADLNAAAPPDAITQRLDGIEQPTRTGQHGLHLNDGGMVPSPFFPCATCHELGSATTHVSVARRATVVMDKAKAFPGLSPAELARLPTPLGTFDPNNSSCTSYCHGSTMQGGVNTVTNWTNDYGCTTDLGCAPAYTMILDCTDCHGLPPPTGTTTIGHTWAIAPTNTRYCGTTGCANHEYHRRAQNANQWDSCAACHYGSASGTFYAGLHVSGKPDIVFSGSVSTPTGTKTFTASWDPVARSCTSSCHVNSAALPHPW